MESFKEGGPISRPPLLDGSHYAYCKVKMIAFLMSIDTKTWKAVSTGWTTPTVTNDTLVIVKLETDWTGEEDEATLENNKALNDIFNVVDINLTTRFETLRIEEDESITSYNNKIKQSNNYYITLIYDDSEEEDDQEGKISNFVSFAAQTKPLVDDNRLENNEDEDEMIEEELLKITSCYAPNGLS
ncbi:hypothetical protein LIER_25129 [Lithospermum erythrorhizon]|uniref:Gag-pol polyprotein n=1 Tax=Lithospermum erythrorhizon TaxID=34254 RepID=A0AAV3R521_LITER